MRVLVAGSSGTIGTHVHAHLRGRHEVIGLAPPGGSPPPGPTITADLLDPDLQIERIAALRPDAVVFAVGTQSRSPATVHDLYLRASARLALALRDRPPATWVHMGNAAVYGDGGVDADEATAPRPSYPLGWTALAVEHQLRSQVAAPGTRLVVLRVAQVYDVGPDGAIRHLSGSYVGHGAQLQSFVHLDDLAEVVEMAIERRCPGLAVVADGRPLDAATAAARVAASRGHPVRQVGHERARRFGPNAYGMLTTPVGLRPTALLAIGWRPRHPELPA